MDFYIVLELPREASPAEIRRAYRRLARRHHPDINPGDPEADLRFRQIVDAYETLIDPDRRRHYDVGGTATVAPRDDSYGFVGFDFSTTAAGERSTTFGDLFAEVFTRGQQDRGAPAHGADLHVKIALSFEDAWAGTERSVAVTRHGPCEACAGSGFHRTREARCATCAGSGSVRTARGHMLFSKACAQCGGEGVQRRVVCQQCHGQGVATASELVTVTVPAGAADGSQLRVPGKGHAGARGGAAGDLYVDLAVPPHAHFVRRGDDVSVVVAVAIHEAALGARIQVTTPDGALTVKVPAGTQSGQQFRFRGRGAPSPRNGRRGDLLVEMRLMLPRLLDERSKELLREFGRINAVSVREEFPAHG